MPGHTTRHFRRVLLLILALSSIGFSNVPVAWSRIPVSPAIADVRDLSERAPLVFRGHVERVEAWDISPEQNAIRGYAIIRVDRQYKGHVAGEVSIPFAYNVMMSGNGHDCINFTPDSYWLVFAVQSNENIEMADDCQGALSVSARLGPQVRDSLWLPQMEADFLAGLHDPGREKRLISLQRLGGLKMPSSRSALHRVMNGPDATEAKWAVYAALRAGDTTVLPQVKILLKKDVKAEQPERWMALALQDVSDPAAATNLIAILETAKDSLARVAAMTALAAKLRDPRTTLVLASHLSDNDPQMRYLALLGVGYITHEHACLLPSGKTIDEQASDCRAWWERLGKSQSWN